MSIHLYTAPFDDLDSLEDEHETAQSLLEELFDGTSEKIIDQRVINRVRERINALQPAVRQQIKTVIDWYRKEIFKHSTPTTISPRKGDPIDRFSSMVFSRSKIVSEFLMKNL
jgi:hypothetical protein